MKIIRITRDNVKELSTRQLNKLLDKVLPEEQRDFIYAELLDREEEKELEAYAKKQLNNKRKREI